MAYAFIGFGLLLLAIGGECVLRGALGLSQSFRLSPLVIGLLVVSIGTSAPELVVSLDSALSGAPAIALGNVVGSNLVNILLILGLGALIRPIEASPKVVLRDGGVLVAASVALVVLAGIGAITQVGGWLLLAGFVAYVALCFITDRRRPSLLSFAEQRAIASSAQSPSLARAAIILAFGVACLYFGGEYVVRGCIALALLYQIPQSVIGLTLVAGGSSMPELATTIVAARQGQTSIAIGNLIGSNIFNILLVLGLTAAIHPLAVPPLLAGADVYAMLAAAVALPLMLAMRWRLTRLQGALLVLAYILYLGFIASRQGYIFPGLFGAV